MPGKVNIFGRILILVVLLLIPILVLYSFSNRTANQVVREQIQSSGLNQLRFFLNQLDSTIDNLAMFPVILGQDPHIRDYLDKPGGALPEMLAKQARITEKLGLQSVSSPFSNDLSIVQPQEKTVLSSNIYVNGTSNWTWGGDVHSVWTYAQDKTRGFPTAAFIREIVEPANAKQVEAAATLYHVSFPVRNISELLDMYKKDKQSDPFLYKPGEEPIGSSTPDKETVQPVIALLNDGALNESGQLQFRIEDRQLLVSYVRSSQLPGWYMVDYEPVERVLAPIAKTRNLFYVSVGLLLMLSMLASFLLYRNVQRPILNLIRSMQRLKRGDLSTRIEYRSKNEFDYLIVRFNEMAEQIQVLVEDVYAEKIRSREATLKQLQSQINPHFLYNSLFFIINSAAMDDRDSVVAMSQHLAEYFRYTTRVDDQTVTLKDELDLIRHYLEIQSMRMHRLQYDIAVPEEMLDETMPRLLIQPLVENAIVHGIEGRPEGGRIAITGQRDDGYNRIVVADSGAGLTGGELERLLASLETPMTDRIGRGTWNVHQRLYYQFGEGSGLTFEAIPEGGLKAVLTWNRAGRLVAPGSGGKGAGHHRSTIDRG
ncbi:sensor histidine kinase [Paenibacillus hodogayensis]|uniref:Sensor histidine kinase n=1 Tax=Paenibacillus hodogayensis TaxID=279208 RepID=A0ABV5VV09_9BACL